MPTHVDTGPRRLQIEFLKSAADLAACPPADEAEIAFAGRSNAGKSSVLNGLTGDRQTARTSKTPGRTRMLNFFSVRGGGRLVDLPGYGYARAGRRSQEAWQHEVNNYLSHRQGLVAVVLVMDARHPFQPFDVELIDWAVASDMPMLVLLNKADKLKYGARKTTEQQARQRLSRGGRVYATLFSAATGIGHEECLGLLETWLRGDADDAPRGDD